MSFEAKLATLVELGYSDSGINLSEIAKKQINETKLLAYGNLQIYRFSWLKHHYQLVIPLS